MSKKAEHLPGFYMDFDHNELEDSEIEMIEENYRNLKKKNRIKKKDKGKQYEKSIKKIKELTEG